MCPIHFQSRLIFLDLPIAYSKAKLKSSGVKAFPENLIDAGKEVGIEVNVERTNICWRLLT
jgi:hypothetical protein